MLRPTTKQRVAYLNDIIISDIYNEMFQRLKTVEILIQNTRSIVDLNCDRK